MVSWNLTDTSVVSVNQDSVIALDSLRCDPGLYSCHFGRAFQCVSVITEVPVQRLEGYTTVGQRLGVGHCGSEDTSRHSGDD